MKFLALCRVLGNRLYDDGFNDFDEFMGEFARRYYDAFNDIDEASEYAWAFVLERVAPDLYHAEPASEMVH